MNDLAEKALHGLGVARREVSARPMLSFAVLGLVISSVVLVAGGDVAAARATRPLTSWLGLQEVHGARGRLTGAVLVAGIAALVLAWLVMVEYVRRRRPPAVRVWWLAGAWAAPFVVGPPLLDTTAYSYVAFGLLQRNGHSPYDSGASGLGSTDVVAAIDPAARDTPSGVGGLGTLVQHLAVSMTAGNALVAVLVLRAVALFAVVLIGRCAAELAGRRRAYALSLTVANPLLLLYVVSAEHLDGLMVALVLAAVLAGVQRRWVRSVVLAALAGSVSGQALVVLPAIVMVHWLGRRGRPTWRVVGRDGLVAALTFVVVGVAAWDGFGWLGTVTKQFGAHTPFAVSGVTAQLLTPIVRGASYDDLAAGARITALIAMAAVLAYLVATARHRPLERTVGYSLLAVALLAPLLYPWYLLWGLPALAVTATGARRVLVLALTAAGCALAPPGFTSLTVHLVTGAALALVALVAGYAWWRMATPVSGGSTPGELPAPARS